MISILYTILQMLFASSLKATRFLLFVSFIAKKLLIIVPSWLMSSSQNKLRQRLGSIDITSHHIFSRLNDRLTTDIIIRIIHDRIKFLWRLRAGSLRERMLHRLINQDHISREITEIINITTNKITRISVTSDIVDGTIVNQKFCNAYSMKNIKMSDATYAPVVPNKFINKQTDPINKIRA